MALIDPQPVFSNSTPWVRQVKSWLWLMRHSRISIDSGIIELWTPLFGICIQDCCKSPIAWPPRRGWESGMWFGFWPRWLTEGGQIYRWDWQWPMRFYPMDRYRKREDVP